MRIILTNDDGIHAFGLRAMYAALVRAGHEVHVVAPMSEQSGVGHSISIHTPLRVRRIEEKEFSGTGVYGTPADCVKLGITQLMPGPPDMVVSGINHGANVGPDILYSGTVAAATEGAHLGYPSLALSCDSSTCAHMEEYADYAVTLMARLPWQRVTERRVLNINFPNIPFAEHKGLKLCPQTDAIWEDWYEKKQDPRGAPYWWLDGKLPEDKVLPGTDRYYVTQGFITLTPLRFSFTDQELLGALGSCGLEG